MASEATEMIILGKQQECHKNCIILRNGYSLYHYHETSARWALGTFPPCFRSWTLLQCLQTSDLSRCATLSQQSSVNHSHPNNTKMLLARPDTTRNTTCWNSIDLRFGGDCLYTFVWYRSLCIPVRTVSYTNFVARYISGHLREVRPDAEVRVGAEWRDVAKVRRQTSGKLTSLHTVRRIKFLHN